MQLLCLTLILWRRIKMNGSEVSVSGSMVYVFSWLDIACIALKNLFWLFRASSNVRLTGFNAAEIITNSRIAIFYTYGDI